MTHPNTSARAIALDLATTTGFALIGSGIITSGSQYFGTKIKKGQPHPPAGLQFAQFENWLKTRLRDDKPNEIAYEEVFRWMSSSAAHVFCGLRAIMLKEALRHQVPCFAYSPTTIKKYWTGMGNAKKDAMVATTIMRFPELDLASDDEADAIALLHLHLYETMPKMPKSSST